MNAQPIAYLNGSYLSVDDARISPLDRGFLFGDAVYEVVPVYTGRAFLLEAHLERLDRSLGELRIPNPLSVDAWRSIVFELAGRNDATDIAVYLQVSRGADLGRDHVIPDDLSPTVFAMATELARRDYAEGVQAITRPDNRWGRCDIKSTALLANVLMRDEAAMAGAAEAILLWNGEVTEGSTSSVLIVENDVLVRRPNGAAVLPGTTTEYVVGLARDKGIECRDETVTEARLRGADEIWLTAATRGLAPVVKLDDAIVGDGSPGPLWRSLQPLFDEHRYGQS